MRLVARKLERSVIVRFSRAISTLTHMLQGSNPPPREGRFRFATRYAGSHLALSLSLALLAAYVVFGLLYPAPYRDMLGVGSIFLLVLAVDVVCGPLLTLILANPEKSQRERWLDFSLVGLIQFAALVYGLHSVWIARPVALVFEVDRLVVVTANEVNAGELEKAPDGLRHLPFWGTLRAGTRQATSGAEMMKSVERSLAGVSPAMQPDWWVPWKQAHPAIVARAKPVTELLEHRAQQNAALQAAIRASGLPTVELRYLPLVSSKTLDWTALLDTDLNIVGWAPVDAFD